MSIAVEQGRFLLTATDKRKELGESHFRSAVSGYELGRREPPLPILLKYARLAGVCVEVLIDDELDLPARLPANPKHKV
jgi:hypothetical protein